MRPTVQPGSAEHHLIAFAAAVPRLPSGRPAVYEMKPDRSKGYVWPVFASYDIYQANVDGSNPQRITTAPGYDAEMTWCNRGGKKVFTSVTLKADRSSAA